MVVVSLQEEYAGHAVQVLALAAQCPAVAYYTKWVIAVDDDVDPTDMNDVLWALSTRCHPAEDLPRPAAHHLVHRARSSQFPPEARPYGSKVLMTRASRTSISKQFPRICTLLRRSTYDRVVERWQELGFSGPAPRLNVFHQD